MLDQQFHDEWLRQHIRGLVLGVDLVEGEGQGPFPLGPGQPMEIFHIDVLGARSGLGELGDGQSTTVVFEDRAVDFVLVDNHWESSLLHLHENPLNGNGCALVAVANMMNSASVLDRAISVCICDFQNRGHPA